jgi:hypothetical protein
MSEQAVTPLNENSVTPADSGAAEPEIQERNKGFRRRILHLVEEMFGPSPNAQIRGLVAIRKSGQIVVTAASDDDLKAAYQRGRADLQAEIVFAERLSAIRQKYFDFDHAWGQVRPLVPRAIWEEAADLEHGLEGAYQLSKLPELAAELAELPPEKARERFRFFVRDLTHLTGGAL